MFQDRYPRETLDDLLGPAGGWRPFPDIADRDAWEGLREQPGRWAQAQRICDWAAAHADDGWPAISARMIMRFARHGDRLTFERAFFARRNRLARLTLAACITDDGRHLEDIVDGIWHICDEASWCDCAHYHFPIPPRRPPELLPRQDRPIVDLFAAETAMVLAESCALLAPRLDAISPAIRERVARECRARVFEPILAYDDWFWWDGHHNWSTWIAGNALGAAGYLLDDHAADRELTWRLLGVLDRYLARYGEDGGCDEGTMYWGVAGGYLLRVLELLHARSRGAIDLYGVPKIANMGRYLLSSYLGNGRFGPFADCDPAGILPAERIWRYGERIDEPQLINLALRIIHGADGLNGDIATPMEFFGEDMMSMLRLLWWVDWERSPEPVQAPLDSWLPSIQVMSARSHSADGEGLVLCAKAGHNTENHNHNDVGQFVLTLDGAPALIDVGVGSYTAQTFGPGRYEIWCIGAQGHAVPVINGHRQQAGPGFGYKMDAARDVHALEPWFVSRDVAYERTADGAVFRLDAAPCYDPAAGVERLVRRLVFDRAAQSLRLEDEIAVNAGPLTVELPLLSPLPVAQVQQGELQIDCGGCVLAVAYDPAQLTCRLEPVPLSDPKLTNAWGSQLTRMVFTASSETARLGYAIAFKRR